jgi:hypothetical protein
LPERFTHSVPRCQNPNVPQVRIPAGTSTRVDLEGCGATGAEGGSRRTVGGGAARGRVADFVAGANLSGGGADVSGALRCGTVATGAGGGATGRLAIGTFAAGGTTGALSIRDCGGGSSKGLTGCCP